MLVIVDDREPSSVGEAAERILSDCVVVVKRLAAGDIRLGGLTVERKTGQDFINSWFTGHLQAQICLLLERTKRPFLAVHGWKTDGLKPADWERVAERITTINLAVPCGLFRDMEHMFLWLADRAAYLRKGEWIEYVKRPVRVVGAANGPVAEIYAGLPGIGAELAERLAAAYPNPAALTDALRARKAWHDEVMGIGRNRAKAIQSVWLGAETAKPEEGPADER